MIFAPLHTGYIGLMGALDSVAVAVGTSPPSFSAEPESNTNLSRGDTLTLSWTAAAGTGALTKYELFKGGVVESETSTAATVFTVGFADFSIKDEDNYVVRVTQANGAYKDSAKVALRMQHLDSGGDRLDPVDGTGFKPHWEKTDAINYFWWEDVWALNRPVTQIEQSLRCIIRIWRQREGSRRFGYFTSGQQRRIMGLVAQPGFGNIHPRLLTLYRVR